MSIDEKLYAAETVAYVKNKKASPYIGTTF